MLGDKRDVGGRQRKDSRKKRHKKKEFHKYGRVKLKHSRKGIESCIYTCVSLILFLFSLLSAFFHRGEAFALAGGMLIIAAASGAVGFYDAVKGLREREKNYLTCRISIAADIVLLFVIFIIYLSGR